MKVKQLSVFLENKQGRLLAACDVLGKGGVNIRALSLADTAEYGLMRLLCDKPEEGEKLLRESGVFVKVTEVLALPMDDIPGGTLSALRVLAEEKISVEYMYACVGKGGKALMIFQTDDNEKASETFARLGFGGTAEEILL